MGDLLRIGDFSDDFDPFTALASIGGEGHVGDPYPELARLRAMAPVHELDLHTHFGIPKHRHIGDLPTFLILGWKEVNDVLETPLDFPASIYERSLGVTFGKTITAMDGAEHQKYRKLIQGVLTPRILQSLKGTFQAAIDRLIDKFASRGSADLVQEFALHFPFQFIMDLMNMDLEQRPTFHKIAFAQMAVAYDPARGKEASRILGEFLDKLVNQRRELKDPNDFVSMMANAEIDGERLSQEIVVSFFRQLMNAGGDTSYEGFSNTLTALLSHPDQMEMLRKDRNLIGRTIEEALRWNCPVMAIQRTTSRDLELAEVKIPKGAFLHVCLGSANRDETIFPNPEKFDITRPPHRQVGFGFGPHICVGQHLARMELTMAMNTLLDRLPNLRLDPDKPKPEVRGLTMRGAGHVYAQFD